MVCLLQISPWVCFSREFKSLNSTLKQLDVLMSHTMRYVSCVLCLWKQLHHWGKEGDKKMGIKKLIWYIIWEGNVLRASMRSNHCLCAIEYSKGCIYLDCICLNECTFLMCFCLLNWTYWLLLRLCCVTYKRLEEEGSVLQEKLNTVKTVWVKWTWIEHTLIHYIIVELWNRRWVLADSFDFDALGFSWKPLQGQGSFLSSL